MSYQFKEISPGGVDYIQSAQPTAEDSAVWVEPSNGNYIIHVSDGNSWYQV